MRSNYNNVFWKRWIPKDFLNAEKKHENTTNNNQNSKIKKSISTESMKEKSFNAQDNYHKECKRGYTDGFNKGLHKAHNEYDLLKKKLENIFLNLNTSIIELNEVIPLKIIDTSLKIAKKIIGFAIEKDNKVIVSNLKNIFNNDIFFSKDMIIYLNPKDIDLVKNEFQKILENTSYKISPNDNLMQGGCKIEFPEGEIDSTIETRLKFLEKTLFENK